MWILIDPSEFWIYHLNFYFDCSENNRPSLNETETLFLIMMMAIMWKNRAFSTASAAAADNRLWGEKKIKLQPPPVKRLNFKWPSKYLKNWILDWIKNRFKRKKFSFFSKKTKKQKMKLFQKKNYCYSELVKKKTKSGHIIWNKKKVITNQTNTRTEGDMKKIAIGKFLLAE